MSTQVSEVAVEIIAIRVGDLIPSKTNRSLSESAIAEMAESIKRDGILQPITARIKDDKTEIVFGECRWRGAMKAGLEVVPVIVRSFTDEEAQAAQIIENLQRTNPSPMDEAESYGNLRKLIGKGATVAQVSAQVGKSEGYIAQRLKLLDLVPEAQKALQADKIGLGHALLIAPLDAEIQKGTIKWLLAGQQESFDDRNWNDHIKTVHTVPALKAFIERHFMLELTKAPFDIADAKLYPKMGACTVCPMNTANAQGLFPDQKTATCTLPSCFYEKRNRTIDIKVSEVLEAEDVKVYRLGVGSSHWNEGTGKIKVDGYLASHSYDSGPRLVKKGDDCKTSRTAVLVFKAQDVKGVNAEVGDVATICTAADCPKHAKQRQGLSEGGADRKALSGMAFVGHKESLLKKSGPERLRFAVYKALVDDLLTIPPKGPGADAKWSERIGWAAEERAGLLGEDSARDAVKALGLWDKSKKKASEMDWGETLAKHFAGKPWSYLLGVLAASDIRHGDPKDKENHLFGLARSFKVDIGKLWDGIKKGDKILIDDMTKRAEERAESKAEARKVKANKKSAA